MTDPMNPWCYGESGSHTWPRDRMNVTYSYGAGEPPGELPRRSLGTRTANYMLIEDPPAWTPEPYIQFGTPRVVDDNPKGWRASTLPVNPDVETGPCDLMVVHSVRHDGTHWFSWQALSITTEAAEQVAAQRGGAWEISRVIVSTTHAYDDDLVVKAGDPGPPGRAPRYTQDVMAVRMRRLPE